MLKEICTNRFAYSSKKAGLKNNTFLTPITSKYSLCCISIIFNRASFDYVYCMVLC